MMGKLMRGLRVGLVLLALPSLLCAGALWAPQIQNNMKLNAFADQLFDLPLPDQTEVMSRSKRVGLHGNGNHCDFLVTQFVVTGLSLETIQEYYGRVTFLPAGGHNEGLSAADESAPLDPQITPRDPRAEDGRQEISISLIDAGHPPGWDLRCH